MQGITKDQIKGHNQQVPKDSELIWKKQIELGTGERSPRTSDISRAKTWEKQQRKIYKNVSSGVRANVSNLWS